MYETETPPQGQQDLHYEPGVGRQLPPGAALPLRVRPVCARPDGHYYRHVQAHRHRVGVRGQELLQSMLGFSPSWYFKVTSYQ